MGRRERAAEANQGSASSVSLSQDTFDAAVEMLAVTLNFDAQAAGEWSFWITLQVQS